MAVVDTVDDTLRRLVDQSWQEYTRHGQDEFVVKPSIPILFFGDLGRYLASPIRTVTVGLNPSRAEFPDAHFRRFPEGRDLDPMARDETFYRQYIATLSGYFRTDPLMRWFNAYEHILTGMESSYGDGAASTALHTDICSPLATDPTWSRLPPALRTALEAGGAPLWDRLIAYLAPNILLVSIARHRLNSPIFNRSGQWTPLHTIPRENPYLVEAKRVSIVAGNDTLVVFGKAAQTPFGKVARLDKEILGKRIKEYMRG